MIANLEKRCPICGRKYFGHSALSRTDNATHICPECGIRQSLESIGITDEAEQNHIVELATQEKEDV